jgi:hypothetical protein
MKKWRLCWGELEQGTSTSILEPFHIISVENLDRQIGDVDHSPVEWRLTRAVEDDCKMKTLLETLQQWLYIELGIMSN